MKKILILISIIISFASCNIKNNSTNSVSTVDSILQIKVDSILQNRLSELDATSGQVIVMEVQTGEIKASAGTELTPQESGLIRTASLLAALETKTVQLSDTVDVGNGTLIIGKDTLLDHNWYREDMERLPYNKDSDFLQILPTIKLLSIHLRMHRLLQKHLQSMAIK